MARSLFTFYPSLQTPASFRIGAAPPLLTINDLWEEARTAVPSLIFRVRTEAGSPGDGLSPNDSLESCVGMIDAAVRWRAVFAMTRTAISAVRHPILADACGRAMAFISSQHPASISPAQRQAIFVDIMKIADRQAADNPDVPPPNDFDQAVSVGVAYLTQADSDEAAASVAPFSRAYCPFNHGTQRPEYDARMATIETMAGAILLTEAAYRLAERMPGWLYAAMPSLKAPPATPSVVSTHGVEVEDKE